MSAEMRKLVEKKRLDEECLHFLNSLDRVTLRKVENFFIVLMIQSETNHALIQLVYKESQKSVEFDHLEYLSGNVMRIRMEPEHVKNIPILKKAEEIAYTRMKLKFLL